MAGFVDVSGMTDSQVKALCQADESDQPLRRQAPGRYSRVVKTYDTNSVFAAAAAAFLDVGQKYIKVGAYRVDDEGNSVPLATNASIMRQYLTDQTKITDAHYDMGQKIRTYFKGLLFSVMSGKVLNEFDSKSLALSNSETVSERDLGVIAYLPQGYHNAMFRQTVEDRISDARGGHIGVVGDKVSFTGEVLKVVFSQQWNCYFVTVITDEDQVAFFSLKFSIDIGRKFSATGTVKTHADNQVTKMSRVKIS